MQDRKRKKKSSGESKPKQRANQKATKAKSGSWLWFGLGLTGVAILSASVGAFLAVSFASTPLLREKLSPEEAAIFGKGTSFSSSKLRLPEVTRPVNILLMGISVLSSDVQNPPAEVQNLSYKPQVNSFDGLTDTMLLLRFNPETKKISILSIPRDTRIVLDKYGEMKINQANVDGGPALSAKAVSQVLEGVTIDRYIRVNIQGVEKLLDTLGGVTVYVPKDIKYQDDSQHLYINLKQGTQHLNGDRALQLLRFRYDQDGDIGRIQRQQMVLRALMEQALNPTTIAKVPNILSVIQSHIDTNLSVEELLALVNLGAKTDRSDVQMLMLPGDFNGDGHQSVSYWLPSRRQIRTMVAQYFDQGYSDREPTDPRYMRVTIQDGVGNPKAIEALVETLRDSGYKSISVDRQVIQPIPETFIVAQQGDEEGAKGISRSLGFGKVLVETSGTLFSDVTIKVGQDWLQTIQTSSIP